MSLVADPRPAARSDARRAGTEPLRRKPQVRRPATGAVSPVRRRTIHLLLVFVTVVLVVDALVGDKGLMQTIRAQRQHRELVASLDDVRRRNAGLREDIRQLREDPAAIEALARKELGLLRPGEVLFIVKDADRPSGPTR
jgi:cell division protein FtsB